MFGCCIDLALIPCEIISLLNTNRCWFNPAGIKWRLHSLISSGNTYKWRHAVVFVVGVFGSIYSMFANLFASCIYLLVSFQWKVNNTPGQHDCFSFCALATWPTWQTASPYSHHVTSAVSQWAIGASNCALLDWSEWIITLMQHFLLLQSSMGASGKVKRRILKVGLVSQKENESGKQKELRIKLFRDEKKKNDVIKWLHVACVEE